MLIFVFFLNRGRFQNRDGRARSTHPCAQLSKLKRFFLTLLILYTNFLLQFCSNQRLVVTYGEYPAKYVQQAHFYHEFFGFWEKAPGPLPRFPRKSLSGKSRDFASPLFGVLAESRNSFLRKWTASANQRAEKVWARILARTRSSVSTPYSRSDSYIYQKRKNSWYLYLAKSVKHFLQIAGVVPYNCLKIIIW